MQKSGFLTGLILALVFVSSCQVVTKRTPEKASSENVEQSNLTQTEAQSRKARLSKVSYHLAVTLGENEKNFRGLNKISFQLKDPSQPLRLDFFEGQVERIKVNDQLLNVTTVKKRFYIEVPATSLKAGPNEIEIQYVADYSREGTGLHRFVDPKTNEVFLYTQFEPFDANRFFPCFDQPDLRASLTLDVTAPASWHVISNTLEKEVVAAGEGRKHWVFPPTPEIATYIFALHAGPFKVWTDRHGQIPLRTFARPSMAEFVRHQEWFKWTKQGLDFFSGYFGYPYPFAKYDHIFVTQFNWGAMENVAAVTVNERHLQRSEPTRLQRRAAANVLMHEMAHMWFGDLVTMSWWNDLWLNESFATFMAHLALAEATEFKEAWQSLYWGQKAGAYWADGMVTTHPIEAAVPSVKVAFANFDEITYGKGAAVLKQLRKYIGEKPFDQGIRLYIKTHAYRNTQLKDFIEALQKYTKKDLTKWASLWLRQSGTDTIAAKWKCKAGQLAEVELKTTPSEGAKFRPQIVELGLFGSHRGRFRLPTSVLVEVKDPVTVVKGAWSCPTFVYPNAKDYGYASVHLDQTSLEYLKLHLSSIQDPLLRALIWNDLWEMVRAGHMPLRQYVEILNAHFGKETDLLNIAAVASNFGRVLYYMQADTDAAKKAREDFVQRFETLLLQRLSGAKPGSEEQKVWFDQFANLVRSPKGLELARGWLEGKAVPTGLNLDVDRRWILTRQLARFSGQPEDALIAKMKSEDGSERGQRQALASEAVQPVAAVKSRWVKRVQAVESKLPLAEAQAILGALFPPEQQHLAKSFAPDFYSYLSEQGQNEEKQQLIAAMARATSPLFCEAEAAQQYRAYIEKNQFAETISRTMKENLQEDERCQKIRAHSGL